MQPKQSPEHIREKKLRTGVQLLPVKKHLLCFTKEASIGPHLTLFFYLAASPVKGRYAFHPWLSPCCFGRKALRCWLRGSLGRSLLFLYTPYCSADYFLHDSLLSSRTNWEANSKYLRNQKIWSLNEEKDCAKYLKNYSQSCNVLRSARCEGSCFIKSI